MYTFDALEILINWAEVDGLRSCYICAIILVTPMEISLRDKKAAVGELCGHRADSVPEWHRDLAAANLEVASGGLERDDGSEGTRSEPAAPKRRYLELVITPPQTGGNNNALTDRGSRKSRSLPLAGWLVGKPGQGFINGGGAYRGCIWWGGCRCGGRRWLWYNKEKSVFDDFFFYLLWVSAFVPTHGQFSLYFTQGLDQHLPGYYSPPPQKKNPQNP